MNSPHIWGTVYTMDFLPQEEVMNTEQQSSVTALRAERVFKKLFSPAFPFEQPPKTSLEVTGPESPTGHWSPALGSQLYPQHRRGLALNTWVVAVTREELAADTADYVFFAG